MAWRDTLLRCFGPGLLGGITAGDWLKVLHENHFAVAPSCLPRALAISFLSLQNSVFRQYEQWRYGSDLKETAVPPPLFLIGHWRSGTTLLQNLLTVDERFAFANNYQALFPHSFLATEAVASRLIALLLPKRRLSDNIAWDIQAPQEDEFALCLTSCQSPCLGWAFPKRQEHYDKYLTYRDVSATELARWKKAYVLFLTKLTWKYGRPLVVKSPPHTCRIRLLLDMFPQAKFVHIHRNPFAVFQSARRMFQVNWDLHRLQRPRPEHLDRWILEQYRKMYDVFFEERGLISAGNFVEVCFEELEADPGGQLRRIYDVLRLPDFSLVEPKLRRYIKSIADYQKNRFPDLPAALRDRIAKEWQPCFREWAYPV